jgi:transposase
MTMFGSRTGFIRRPPICPEERPHPDWAAVHRELRPPGVTLMLLWEEYCDSTSGCFSYSWFCERYKEWAGRLNLSLR